MRILFINDNEAFLTVCKAVLEARGHALEVTTDASAVTAALLRFQPDVLVLDWLLNDRTGGDVLDELHGGRAPPVLVVSSLDDIESEARQRGARGFLRKPFSDDALVAAVEGLILGG